MVCRTRVFQGLLNLEPSFNLSFLLPIWLTPLSFWSKDHSLAFR